MENDKKEVVFFKCVECVILQEQNKTLKGKKEAFKGEKLELIEKFIHISGNTDTTENKIETEFEVLKEELMNEINSV